MEESIGLNAEELGEIQRELRDDLNNKMQDLITEIQDQQMGDGVDLVSMMAGKDSIALQTSIDFSQKIIEMNNRKISDMMQSRDTLVLQTAIDFVQRAIEANNKKIFAYIEQKMKEKK
ncbi:MAG: hypothetical protein AABZ74_18915 [Cyanobacteriota bacterium]|jgi:hypothetical protein